MRKLERESKGGERWNGKWELSERFTDKETSNTAGRRALSEVTRSADEGVARWSAVYQKAYTLGDDCDLGESR